MEQCRLCGIAFIIRKALPFDRLREAFDRIRDGVGISSPLRCGDGGGNLRENRGNGNEKIRN